MRSPIPQIWTLSPKRYARDNVLAGIVAGSRSGCGKTTATLSLMAALARRGLVVRGCKSGPDFIDPGYHRLITGQPSFNLDSWMGGESGVFSSFARAIRNADQECSPDIMLIEGAMALFDGSGAGITGSTAHLAELLDIPVILTLDVKGLGQSVAALAKGFTEFLPGLEFAGIICTHAGGPAHAEIIREALADCPAPLLGILPRKGAPELKSRHLGLLMANEGGATATLADEAACWFEENVNVDFLLSRLGPVTMAEEFGPPESAGANVQHTCGCLNLPCAKPAANAPAVGIACDEAFCFMYPDFPELLREYGASPIFFSPLHDAAPPPECAALIFPGGYPELHAKRLSVNISMREAIKAFASLGKTVYGECGGYMYLMESLENQGESFAMSGCLPLACRFEGRMIALGYREARPFGTCAFGDAVGRGHEYHYSQLKDASTLPPLWHISDRLGRKLEPEGACLGSVCGSWVHLFPEGSRALWRNFVKNLH